MTSSEPPADRGATPASPGPPAIGVLVVDDDPLVRAGLMMMLGGTPDLRVVAEAGDGTQVLPMVDRHRPDVILMDIRMPNMDGIEATRRLIAGEEPPRVVILTTFDLDEYVYRALAAGASGFLLKDLPPLELVNAIRVVAQGEALLAPSVTRRLIERFARVARPESGGVPEAVNELTARELEVLRLVARGLSNAEIAAELVVGENTVKTHVAHVLSKLGLRDRVQAVVLAYETGLVAPELTPADGA
jgi:DNA-binding NarL/FixJ family response regulator